MLYHNQIDGRRDVQHDLLKQWEDKDPMPFASGDTCDSTQGHRSWWEAWENSWRSRRKVTRVSLETMQEVYVTYVKLEHESAGE